MTQPAQPEKAQVAIQNLEMTQAATAPMREAVFKLRYQVYVEEMGRYRKQADHANRRLAEPEDERGWHLTAIDGDRVVAAARITWGGDGFSARQHEQYRLAPFLGDLPAAKMAIGERTVVAKELRGTTILAELIASGADLLADHGVELVFGACEPHLLPLYLDLGQRPYADRNINSDDAGYLVPLVSLVPHAGNGVNAPLTDAGKNVRLLAGSATVRYPTLIGAERYRDEVHAALADLPRELSPFSGLDTAAVDRCIARSTVIECRSGDRVIKRHGSARNVFVVLAGALEVRNDHRVVAGLTPGDLFGETAFQLDEPRGADVDAVTDVRLLSLSAGTLRDLIAGDAATASVLLANLARALCQRLARAANPM